MSIHTDLLTEADIQRHLQVPHQDPTPDWVSAAQFAPEFITKAPRSAAVLIPLLRQAQSWHVLLTRRQATLAEHSGQVAFPGGRSEPGDRDAVDTALREAREEIGLQPADVHILGKLRDFITITNYRVTPVVGAIPWPYPLHLAQEEVSRAFIIPLDWLMDPENYEERQRTLPSPYGHATVIYYHPFDGEVLWGASARFVATLIQDLKLNNHHDTRS